MNCLDFRRHKLSDPGRLPEEARAHAAACPACSAFARDVDPRERELERALAVPVPDGLAERSILRSRRPHRAWQRWALAATVLLALAIGASLPLLRKDPELYARLAIEHVAMEPESFTAAGPADAEAFRSVVQNFGATLKEMPGTIRYMRLCPVEDGFGWHIVFDTPEGAATMILVPGKRLAAPQSASKGSWSALARPVRGGYYAVITPSMAATASFDRMLRGAIVWS
jgi:hypothetical protein